jgi:hypothetical protein
MKKDDCCRGNRSLCVGRACSGTKEVGPVFCCHTFRRTLIRVSQAIAVQKMYSSLIRLGSHESDRERDEWSEGST